MVEQDIQRLRWWAGVFAVHHIHNPKPNSVMVERYRHVLSNGSVADLLN